MVFDVVYHVHLFCQAGSKILLHVVTNCNPHCLALEVLPDDKLCITDGKVRFTVCRTVFDEPVEVGAGQAEDALTHHVTEEASSRVASCRRCRNRRLGSCDRCGGQCADLLIETDEDASDADEAAEHITRVADEIRAAMTDEDHEVSVLATRTNILHLDSKRFSRGHCRELAFGCGGSTSW